MNIGNWQKCMRRYLRNIQNGSQNFINLFGVVKMPIMPLCLFENLDATLDLFMKILFHPITSTQHCIVPDCG
jgi:hypothetical protein